MNAGAGSAYDVLGVSPDATPDEIDGAYRRLAKLVHPDTGGDRFAFEELQRAYEQIATTEARAAYDRRLHRRVSGPRVRPQPEVGDRPSTAQSLGVVGLALFDIVTYGGLALVALAIVLLWILFANHAVAGAIVIAVLVVAGVSWLAVRARRRGPSRRPGRP